MQNNEIRVRVFGFVELENAQGCAIENTQKPVLHWALFKYLLANPGREIGVPELLETAWPDKDLRELEGTIRIRLKRMRQVLKPLGVQSPDGLLLYRAGQFSLNPAYTLRTDDELLVELMDKLRPLPPDAPEGLQLCVEALELFRGKYFAHTTPAPWLDEARRVYDDIFCELGRETMRRTVALSDGGAVTLLRSRAVAIVPDAEELHRSILGYLVEHKRTVEVMRYMADLSHAGGTGPDWLKTLEI